LLIADDEEIIRNGLLSIKWEELDVHVVGAVSNGFDAMEILQGDIIDILLTDIRMPGIDGLELAQFVHKYELCTRVILLSGYSDFEYARKGIKYNVVQYILKPSKPEEIIGAVKLASGQVETRRQADMRLRLLEAELGKRQLVMDDGGFILGEIRHSSIVDKIIDYIAGNFRRQISLSSMSLNLSFSTIYLSRVIKNATGFTFLEVVNAMRLDAVAAELREGSLSLEDIGESVSIHGPRYLSQIFRKYYGKSPSEYKKEPSLPVDRKLSYLVKTIHGKK
jgi:YesN/AraC family two-component response regulator